MVIYKEIPHLLELNSGTYHLIKASAMTSLGSIAATSFCRPFVHPEDNVLYMGFDYTISRWDGTTFTSYSSIIPTDMTIVSLTDYGTYLAILCTSGTGRSKLYLWGRDGTINTLQGVIDVGSEYARLIENIDNELVIISTTLPTYSVTRTGKIICRIYAGGTPYIAKSIQWNTTNGNIFSAYKEKSQGKLYFTGDREDCLYAFGKNKEGYWTITKDRYLNNGNTYSVYSNSIGFSLIGDILYSSFVNDSNVPFLYRTGTTYSATSYYTTTINPSMPLADRTQLKQLEAVQIAYTGAASGTVGIDYSIDGGAYASIINESTTAIEDAKEATNETDGKPLASGTEITFRVKSVGGVKIKEIKYRYSLLNSTI